MAIDPVCGTDINPMDSDYLVEYGEEVYYFCGPGCQEAFALDPDPYLMPENPAEDPD